MSKRDAIQRRKRAREKDDVTQIPSVPPRIESLSVEGLRGFREKATLKLASPTGESGSGLTIVVGANNAGKSTLWESFDALARKSKSDISFSEGKRNRGSAFGVTISLTREDGSTYALQSQRADSSETLGQWISPSASTGSTGLEIVTVPSRRQFQSTFSKQIASERDWMISGGDYSRSQSRDQFTGRMFDLHSDNAKKAAFDDLMARVLGYPFDWTIDLADGQYGGSYYLKISTGEGSTHTSEGLGDGIISLLFIINALYDSLPGTLIVLDEPELSLHPQLVRRLGREIARFARDRQIVVLTHSPLLVSWADISAGAEIARVYKLGSNSTIAQPSRHAVEKISEHRNDWRNPHVLGVDAAEALFLDDGVIVVEGQEDAALLPRVFELADVPQKGVVYGWGSGGAGNVQKVLALLAGLGFKKVAAVIDGNVPDTASALERQFPGFHVATIPADDIRTKPAAGDKAEVRGLLDSHGRSIDTELLAPTRVVLEGVNRYFAEASPAAGFPANKHSSQAEVAS